MTTEESRLARLGSRELVLAAVLALAIATSAVAFPMLVDARPAYEIPVDQQGDPADLTEPTGDAWEEVPAASVPMSSAGAAVPGGDDTAIEGARVEAARTSDQLYIRLSWGDTSENRSTESLNEFADAAAVQLPANGTDRPPIAMGSTSNPVNVWYWSGDDTSESLLAGGPGSTTQIEETNLETAATHEDGRWNVVFTRPLAADGEHVTDATATNEMDVAFAVWEGSNMERSGQKATTEWYYLALEPDTSAAPYETILWTVAGLAIVLTTLVTIEGVRRTRGD